MLLVAWLLVLVAFGKSFWANVRLNRIGLGPSRFYLGLVTEITWPEGDSFLNSFKLKIYHIGCSAKTSG